jgi:hypothetical protein
MAIALKRLRFKAAGFGMRQIKTISKWALASAKFLYRFLAVSAEVLCRHTFGIRYATDLLISLGVFILYAFVAQSLNRNGSPIIGPYLICYSALVCFHLVSTCKRRVPSVHSYSTGHSWPFWKYLMVNPTLLDFIVEPGCIFLAGILLFSRDPALAFWLQLSALCLFAKRSVVGWTRWYHLLDVLDTRIEGEKLNEAVRERTASRARTASGHTPVSAGQAPEQNQPRNPQSLDGIFNNLDPALRRLLSNDGGRVPNASTRTAPEQNQPQGTTGGPLDHLPRIKSNRR